MKSIAKSEVAGIVLAETTHAGVKYAPGADIVLPKHDFDYLERKGKIKSVSPTGSTPAPAAVEERAATTEQRQDQAARAGTPEVDPGTPKPPKGGTITMRRSRRKG